MRKVRKLAIIKKRKLLSPNGNLYAKSGNFISKNGKLHAKSGK